MSKKIKKAIPELRFSKFEGSSDWKQHKLKNITKKIGSGATPTGGDNNYKESGISLFRSLNVYDGFFKLENLAFIDQEQAKKLDNVTVKKGDILFNITGASIARCCIAPIELLPARVNQHVMIIRPDFEDITTEFLSLVLICNSYKKKLFRLGGKGGSTREALTKEHIESFEILHPSIAEQEKIASFLGAIDIRLTQLRRKHKLLQTHKRGVMQKIFSQEVRFKGAIGGAFPDWQKKKLGELFKWIRTNSLSRESLSYEFGTVQNIHYGDIHKKFKSQFRLSKEEVPYINDEILVSNLAQEDFCKIGDLVIADASEDYADIGKAVEIVEVEPSKLVAGLHCFIARPKEKMIVGYSGYLVQSEDARKQIKRIAQGVSVLGISKTNLENINLPYPCIEEQEKIADFLTAIDQKIEAVARQVDRTEQFKKGLLQKMFV